MLEGGWQKQPDCGQAAFLCHPRPGRNASHVEGSMRTDRLQWQSKEKSLHNDCGRIDEHHASPWPNGQAIGRSSWMPRPAVKISLKFHYPAILKQLLA